MLEGTETKSAIEQALAVLNLVPTGLRFETTVPPAHARAQPSHLTPGPLKIITLAPVESLFPALEKRKFKIIPIIRK